MRDSISCKSLFILGALLMSASVFGQGGGDGGGSGQGRGREHMGRPGQKSTYENVNSLVVYSANGVKIYPAQKSPAKKKTSGGAVTKDQIKKVEINPKGVRIYFESKKGELRIIDLKCTDCIVLVDHIVEPGHSAK